MPAHGGCRLLILQRVEFFIQCGKRLGQHRRRNGDIDQFAGRSGQQWAIADRKETKAKIGEPPVVDDGLRCEADDCVVAMSAGEFMKKYVEFLGLTGNSTATSNSCGLSAVS